jgi:protein NirF
VKLPHLASWAVAGRWIFVPLVGEDRLAVLDRATWSFERSIPVRGHPVYAVRSPTEREVWVSFSGEADDAYVQVIDTERLEVTDTIRLGRRIYHMDFTPRGSHVLVSANQDDRLFLVNAGTHRIEDVEELKSPSGIFGVWRAFRIGL